MLVKNLGSTFLYLITYIGIVVVFLMFKLLALKIKSLQKYVLKV